MPPVRDASQVYWYRETLVLYRRRAFTSVVKRKAVLRRAFDKAVRRKPLAFTADAGLWEFNAGAEAVSNSAGV